MNVVDLFCGLKGWSAPAVERGHRVFTSDYDPRFEATVTTDVRDLDACQIRDFFEGERVDLLLASPPCESFSVASIGHHWGGGARAYEPKTEEARVGMQLVQATVRLIEDLRPRYAVVENPRDVLRKLGIIPVTPQTVWYCHYGETRAKPTDLWGLPFPPSWVAAPVCHNRRPGHGEDCCCHDHEAASRGAKTGTQGIGRYDLRSVIPYDLALSVTKAAERDLEEADPCFD